MVHIFQKIPILPPVERIGIFWRFRQEKKCVKLFCNLWRGQGKVGV